MTVDGVTHSCPAPHIVIATQNHVGTAGALPLPESQMDRFTIRLTMGYPSLENEVTMLKDRQGANPLSRVEAVATAFDITEMKSKVENVYRSDEIFDYIARLVKETREHSMIALGVSPRGSLALSNMAAASAFLHKRDYVIPEDVKRVFTDVCAHRVIMNSQARISDVTAEAVLDEIVRSVKEPAIRG